MEKSLYQKLADLNISYEVLEHPAFFSCEESVEFAAQNPGGHAKTLFLRDKKKKHYFLAVVEDKHRIDTKALCQYLECSGGKLSFGSAEDLQQILQVRPGSVTPFALLSDNQNKIQRVLIDTSLKQHRFVYFHPMRNTASVKIKLSDFEKFLDSLSHNIEFFPF
ncbi:hypothetical protein CSB37_01285 [bacterium DOLZORAL124_38_8]|nr:MAG: hypothetical protein CSB37_01285 [bacterium DOLZORAL124_38_8]